MRSCSLVHQLWLAALSSCHSGAVVDAKSLTPRPAEPTYSFRPFSFTVTNTAYATSVPPATSTTSYAAPSQALISSLLPSLSYTTWGNWNPTGQDATDTNDAYGQAAWTALWRHANPPNFTETGLFKSTVSPTPVPSSELVLPPSDPFGPPDGPNFPEGFIFGVASSASQIEGSVADEGKAPSALDISIQDGRPKNYVTNEFYYYYKQDIERVAAMGVRHFAFSIPWTRILPFALPGTPVNRAAIRHYDDMITFILEKGMVPVVTLLHFDSPLQFFGDNLTAVAEKPRLGYQNGGYQNDTFPDAFVNYARVVMAHYADRVPIWFTFNEPLLYATDARAVDHVLRAHARVWHFYKDELKGTGQVSLKLNNNFGIPRNASDEADVYAANHFNSLQLGTFLNPILLGGDYPASFKQTFPDYLPLSRADLAYMNGTASFLGVDPYTATIVSPPTRHDTQSILSCAANISHPLQPLCVTQSSQNLHGWNIGYRSQSYVYTTPTHLRTFLSYLWNTWHTPIAITEFGFPVFHERDKTAPDQAYDSPRSEYYLSFMQAVLQAIWRDGVHVTGAFAWSYADNWEFGDYGAQFGLQVVNRTTQARVYKKSFFDLVGFVRARGVR